ncbi:MAG TPA: pantoate--beta-alanine ligase [Nakamurella sp.]|nr:pantoate--beta-alanine ligase [Nakamurella sp.]
MKTVRTVRDLRAALSSQRAAGASVALVPTMGALHDGHLELARRARAENDVVVMSIFVNPSQFNDPADLAGYPRDEAADADLAAEAGVDLLFVPLAEEVYPPGFTVTVALHGPVVETLEGTRRGAGHFRGVATVVSKLLNMAEPQRAYFGAKDAQQARVVRALVADLNIDTEIVTVPTVREPDGLAMSSRNRRLAPDERTQARGLFAALRAAQQMSSGGEGRVEVILAEANRILAEHGITPEYLALVDADTFLPAATVGVQPAVLLVAAQIGGTRLIDNVRLGAPPTVR